MIESITTTANTANIINQKADNDGNISKTGPHEENVGRAVEQLGTTGGGTGKVGGQLGSVGGIRPGEISDLANSLLEGANAATSSTGNLGNVQREQVESGIGSANDDDISSLIDQDLLSNAADAVVDAAADALQQIAVDSLTDARASEMENEGDTLGFDIGGSQANSPQTENPAQNEGETTGFDIIDSLETSTENIASDAIAAIAKAVATTSTGLIEQIGKGVNSSSAPIRLSA